MNKKIKKLWVKALRSGRYKQGHNYLKLENRYCCLGVLCNVMGAKWRVNDDGFPTPHLGGKDIDSPVAPSGLLGSGFLRKIGMKHNTQKNLSTMNDEGKSFKEIADYIEKRL